MVCSGTGGSALEKKKDSAENTTLVSASPHRESKTRAWHQQTEIRVHANSPCPSIHPSIHAPPPAPQPGRHRASELHTCPPWHCPCLLQTQRAHQKPQLGRPGLCQQTSRNIRKKTESGKRCTQKKCGKEAGSWKSFEGRKGSFLRRSEEMWDKIPQWKLSEAFGSDLHPVVLWVINTAQVPFRLGILQAPTKY